MKNKDFFYQQYDKINWENQEKTKINSFIYQFIIQQIFLKKKSPIIKIFDIGFGVGFFLKMLAGSLNTQYKQVVLEGCEPSEKNYNHLMRNPQKLNKGVSIETYNKTFIETQINKKFDFITSIYTFTAFVFEELVQSAKKINSLLEKNGKFILVVANEKYLEEKLKSKKDLSIESDSVIFKNKRYKEILHYSEIPQIGKVIDYNREEKFYIDLFEAEGFKLAKKENLNDNGFICTIFSFDKK